MPRGKLKIFFGAFPGAGKTDAMLTAARRVRDAGRDVVVAVVDTHDNPETAELLDGFEILPPLAVAGNPVPGELNLDGALARRPEVILVDDLAHPNPPGSRHPKRWNDADELLANGIDVFTTMGVQHLESLNDVVGEICGIHERETVPDTFFDSAEETIMVDMSADELLARLKEGKVHVGEAEKGAEKTYYSKGSLLALREIALRRTADVVEDEVQKVRAEKHVDAVWKTHGHLLCCIGPQPGSEHVVRSAARLAKQLDSEWTAVYVETPRLQRLPPAERGRILNVVRLAEELGARTAILTGTDVVHALVDYAREQNIGSVVVGRGRPATVRFSRTMSDALAAASPNIDVIEIGRGGAEAGTPVAAPAIEPDAAGSRAAEKRLRYFWTFLASLATALAALALYPRFELATVVLLFMLTVVLIAVRWGRGPAIFAAILDVALVDFFFVAPRFSFGLPDPHYFLTFFVMLAAGVVVGQLAGNLRFQARVASHREKRARTLYEFARDLARLQTTSQVIETAESFMSRHFRARVSVLVPDATGLLVSPTGSGMSNPFDSTAAQWAYDQAQQAGAGTDTLAGNEYLFLPLKSPTRTRGVLAVRPERTRDLFIPEQRHQFEIFAALVATTLERVHYMDVARDAMLMARIQGRDMHLELERRPLAELVDGALRQLGALTARHPVAVDVPSDLPLVNVEPDLIQRVFTSLVGNVVKHTPAGTHITISARVAGDFVEVRVEDDGPGLPEGREEEVFESFSRGEKPGARRGAGLGLAICRAIVEAHGGTIRSERRAERGARFVFTLPLRRNQG
ncbi:MAG TPA: ATP-binding protein [Usitatibacter sp.]|nr:ATP-binding protein [Usitatibacter sp.]